MRVARSLADVPRVHPLVVLGAVALAALLGRLALLDVRPNSAFHGHGYCYLWQTDLVAAHVVSDTLIGLSYLAISLTLVYLVRRTREGLPYSWMFVAFGTFIVACGATHFMEIWTLWTPVFWLSADIKIVTAAASVATAVLLPPLVPRVLHMVELARVSEERRQALARASGELERRVLERTAALNASLEREQALRATAEAANRTKEEFLATVSHELRTPLNAIMGWAEILQRTEPTPEQTTHGITAIARNARAQARVVDDLLDVARIASGKLTLDWKTVELAPVVHAALEIVRPAADARAITVHDDSGDEALMVRGDPARLQQITWNLLSNAVKFTPEGGRIDVRVERSASHARIVVTDTGIGFDAAFTPYLFDRFTQADSSTTRPFAGLGLGLAISRHLVELHGGSITAKSEGSGKGATFTVEIPLARDPVRLTPEGSPIDVPGRRLNDTRVLVIDDDVESRDVVAAIVASAGGQVVTAKTAADGLAGAMSMSPDVVVCDIGMAHEDGYAFIRQLRSADRPEIRSVPVVALTGYAGADEARRAVEAGFDLHLAKPVSPDVLVDALAGLAPRSPRRTLT
jgi:signal transduction histidine kinase/ActR/RegA family two-component response regulator